jgi:hypothetical protein
MKSYLKTTATVTTNTIDQSTGELIDQEILTHKFMTKDKEEFFLIYASLIGLLGELSTPAVRVLSYVLLTYKSASQFEIGGATRTLIAGKMRLSSSAIVKGLAELVDNTILFSPSRSMYIINPRFAFKGSTSDRTKEMRAIIELGCKDC